MHQTLEVSLPSTNLEVKIVLPIVFCSILLKACPRRARIVLCESREGLQYGNQAAHEKTVPHVFEPVHHYLLLFCLSSCLDGLLCETPCCWPPHTIRYERQGSYPEIRANRSATFINVDVITRFVSQVFPPSSENACSRRQESGGDLRRAISNMWNPLKDAEGAICESSKYQF